MIIDERNEFADALSVAAAAGTALIGDVIDLGVASRDIGNGEPLYLVIQADVEIITGGAAGTVSFSLASDAQAAIATDGSATVHATSEAFVTGAAASNAKLAAGEALFIVAVPTSEYEQFVGVLCTTGTTTTTAGSINAFLTKDVSNWKAYDGVTG